MDNMAEGSVVAVKEQSEITVHYIINNNYNNIAKLGANQRRH